MTFREFVNSLDIALFVDVIPLFEDHFWNKDQWVEALSRTNIEYDEHKYSIVVNMCEDFIKLADKYSINIDFQINNNDDESFESMFIAVSDERDALQAEVDKLHLKLVETLKSNKTIDTTVKPEIKKVKNSLF